MIKKTEKLKNEIKMNLDKGKNIYEELNKNSEKLNLYITFYLFIKKWNQGIYTCIRLS